MQFDTTMFKISLKPALRKFTAFLCLLGALTCLSHHAFSQDTDGDGILDSVDIDDDNDGILDVNEVTTAVDVIPLVGSNVITNGSFYGTNYDPALNSTNVNSWSASSTAVNTWYVGVMFDGPSAINSVSTQRRFNSSQRVTTYRVQATKNGTTWTQIGVKAGNTVNDDTIVTNTFATTDTDWIGVRLEVAAFIDYPSMRFGVNITPQNDLDNDGIDSSLDIDSDGDGIPDNIEAQLTTSYVAPTGLDNDNDGLDNAYDTTPNGTSDGAGSLGLTPVNTDGADQADFLDTDSDNDTILDIFENGDTDNVASGTDSDSDGLDNNFDAVDNSAPTSWDANDEITGSGSAQLITTFGDLDGDASGTIVPGSQDLDYRDDDFDNDGIEDAVDFDDDNDGILDADECTTFEITETAFSFSADGTFETLSGVASSDAFNSNINSGGAGWIDSNGSPDSWVSPMPTTGSGLWGGMADGMPSSPDGGVFAGAWVSASSFEAFTTTVTGLTIGKTYRIKFYQANAGIDGLTAVGTTNTTRWQVDFGAETQFSTAMDYKGEGNQVWMEETLTFTATSASQVLTFTADNDGGAATNEVMAVDGIRIFEVDALGQCTTDTDGDGLPDSLDLDSDGDNCADALEGGGTLGNGNLVASTLPGGSTNIQTNLGNTVDTNPASASYGVPTIAGAGQSVGFSKNNSDSSSCTDSDSDGINDYVDLDDDNDGILDTLECPEVTDTWGTAPWVWTTGVDNATIVDASGITFTLDVSTTAAGDLDAAGGTQLDAASGGFTGGIDDIAVIFDPDPGEGISPVTITATFSQPVRDLSFLITDIEASGKQDKVTVTSNTGVIPTLSTVTAGVPTFTISANSATGTVAYSGNDDRGSVRVSFSGLVQTVTIVYEDALAPADPGSRGVGVFGDMTFCGNTDTDADTIPDYLDLDSDGDSCPDAIEGGGTLGNSQLVTSAMPGGATSVQDNLGTTVDGNGVPTIAAGGQSVGLSRDNTLSGNCTDSDNDGINDYADLDDDNDGILDTDECLGATDTWGTAPWVWTTGVDNATIVDASGITFTLDVSTTAAGDLDAVGGTQLDAASGGFAGGIDDIAVLFDPDPGEGISPVTITATFSTPVRDLSFLITDIEASGKQEKVTVTSNTGLIPTLSTVTAGVPTFTISANTATGSVAYTANDDRGSVRVSFSGLVQTVTIVYEDALAPADPITRGVGVFGDMTFCGITDTDADTIPDYLDLDSDGDSCPDAMEGGGTFVNNQLVTSTMPGGSTSVQDNLGNTVDTDPASASYGVPTIAGAGQSAGFSKDSSDSSSCTDSDGDGFNDYVDLDDDNDGILDTDECTTFTNTETPFSFSADGTFETLSGVASSDAFNSDVSSGGSGWTNTSGTLDSWVSPMPTTGSGLFGGMADGMPSSPDGGVFVAALAFTNYNETMSTTITGLTIGKVYSVKFYQANAGIEGNTTVSPSSTTRWQVDFGAETQFSTAMDYKGEGNQVWMEETLTFTATSTSQALAYTVDIDGAVPTREVMAVDGIRIFEVSAAHSACLTDTDSDGLPDSIDLDSDGDGCADAIEGGGTFVNNQLVTSTISGGSTGVQDNLGNTVDANGVPTIAAGGQSVGLSKDDTESDLCTDTDNDGINDYVDIDDDNDGVLDTDEGFCTSIAVPGANASNAVEEAATVTNPGNAVDGVNGIGGTTTGAATMNDQSRMLVTLRNGDPVAAGTVISIVLQKLSTNTVFLAVLESSDGVVFSNAMATSGVLNTYTTFDYTLSTDAIALSLRVFTVGGTGSATIDNVSYPSFNTTCTIPDTDGDGISDHLDLDSDNDGTPDIIEAGGLDTDGDGRVDDATDTDNDGFADTFDTDNGGTNLEDPDSDGDGVADRSDLDSDNDGTPDIVEAGGTDANGDGKADSSTDTNGDGFVDTFDTDNGGTNLEDPDSDGDGNVDRLDLDSDNDGIADIIEAGGTDADGDGVVDSSTDTDGDGFADTFDTDNGGTNLENPDSDGDGLDDRIDLDSDNDGIADIIEAGGTDANGDGKADSSTDTNGNGFADTFDTDNGGTNLEDPDTDGDGVADRSDLDSDNDGTPDIVEAGGTDANGDGKADSSTDTNGDGFVDTFDTDNGGTNLTDPDSDGDGNVDRLDLDSDNDGIADIIEAGGSDADGDGKADSSTDTDGDGFADTFDTDNGGTNLANPDSDGDGLDDRIDLDSDNDGIADIIEAGGSDADGDGKADSSTDTNGDGFADTFDTDNGGTNLEDPDSDGDGVADRSDLDSDNDGTPDIIEAGGTDANGDGKADNSTDTNGDGFVDTFDTDNGGTNLADPDTDGDGNKDRVDLDSDNDGIADIIEAGGVDTDGDGQVDSSTDTDGDGFADTFDADNGGTNLTNPDTDGDGNIDRLDLDSDNDGITDIIEAGGTDANGDGKADSSTDTDGDGFVDTFDTDNGGTNLEDPDTDGDGNKDRLDLDADADGIVDLIEAQATTGSPITPTGNDTDSDGLDDAFDTDCSPCGGTIGVAIMPVNTDGTDEPDYKDIDSDNDGLLDLVEAYDTDGNFITNTMPNGLDADNDGLDDAFDNVISTNPTTGPTNGGQTANTFPDNTTSAQTTERDWREAQSPNPLTTNPGGIGTNLLLWVKANYGGTLWQDISGSATSVTAAGSPINGSLLNFNAANSFDGSDYYNTNLDINADTYQDLAVFAVYVPTADNSGAVWGENNGGFDRYTLDDSGGSENQAVSNGTANESGISGLFTAATPTLSSVVFDEDQVNGSSVFVNGQSSLQFTADHGGESSNNLQLAALGANDRTFNGRIAEVIVYNQLLATATDRQQVESYLALKYGITLSADTDGDNTAFEAQEGDYIASDGTTVFWDASVNSTHHHNVAGIARDDDTCLNQKQSKSANSDAIVTIGLDASVVGLPASNAANTNTFSTDKSAMVWGHDGEALTDNDENIDFDPTQVNSRLNREWKVRETGTVGKVSVVFDVSNIPGPSGPGTSNESDIVLLLDADGDFSSGAQIVSQSLVVADDGKVRFSVDFSDNTYFTLASSESYALPITLISFEAAVRDSDVLIEWVTASEENNSHFVIERSSNGTEFTEVAIVAGQGNTDTSSHYQLIDKNPFTGVNFYRLTDVSFGGKRTTSELIRIMYEGNTGPQVSAPYPNPVSAGGLFYINLGNADTPEAISLFDFSGNTVPIKTKQKGQRLSIHPGNIAQGVYLLRLKAGKKIYSYKVKIIP